MKMDDVMLKCGWGLSVHNVEHDIRVKKRRIGVEKLGRKQTFGQQLTLRGQ